MKELMFNILTWQEVKRVEVPIRSVLKRILIWLHLINRPPKAYWITVDITIDRQDYLHPGDIILIPIKGPDDHNFCVLRSNEFGILISSISPVTEQYTYQGEAILISSACPSEKTIKPFPIYYLR